MEFLKPEFGRCFGTSDALLRVLPNRDENLGVQPHQQAPPRMYTLIAGYGKWVELLAPALLLCLLVALLGTAAQKSRGPFSATEVISLLKAGVAPVRLEALAHDYGISFQLTPHIEAELRSAGATDALIKTLRQLAPPSPSPSPPPPPLPTGSASVTALPGTQVYVDNSTKPTATMGPDGVQRVSGLSIGSHRFRLVHSGYDDCTTSIDIPPGKMVPCSCTQHDQTGSVTVAAPPGTQIYVDNSTTPAAIAGPDGMLRVNGLSIGNHQFRLVRSGYDDCTISANIQVGKTVTSRCSSGVKVPVPPPPRPLIGAPKPQPSPPVVSFHVTHLHQLLGTCHGTLIIGHGMVQYIASKKSHSFGPVRVDSLLKYGPVVYGANFFLVLPSGKDYDFRGPVAAVTALDQAKRAMPAAASSGQ
jgi:hypothetical protein